MEDEEERSFHLPYDALPNAAQGHDLAPFHGRERGVDGAQQRRTDDARPLEWLPHDAWGQRLEIDRDVGKLRHLLVAEHLQRYFDSAERRADLDSLHHPLHTAEHVAR